VSIDAVRLIGVLCRLEKRPVAGRGGLRILGGAPAPRPARRASGRALHHAPPRVSRGGGRGAFNRSERNRAQYNSATAAPPPPCK